MPGPDQLPGLVKTPYLLPTAACAVLVSFIHL